MPNSLMPNWLWLFKFNTLPNVPCFGRSYLKSIPIDLIIRKISNRLGFDKLSKHNQIMVVALREVPGGVQDDVSN